MSILPKIPWIFKFGALNCALTTVFGAAGGHKHEWDDLRQNAFKTAILYNFTSNFGIMISSFITSSYIPVILFTSGNLFFCGSLYHRSFTGEKTYSGKYTPIGGMSLICAWLSLAFLQKMILID